MDGEVFYFAGGVLVLAALVFSAIGIRNHEKFPPSSGVMTGIIVVFAALVIGATGTAVVLAREEQDHRRHELAHEEEHAAAEAQGEVPAGDEAHPPPPPPPGGGAETTLDVTSPEDGSLVFEPNGLEARAGTVTLVYANPSAVPHSIAIEVSGEAIEESDTITDGETDVSAELAPGEYVFFCSVPGHRESGMEGDLTVVP